MFVENNLKIKCFSDNMTDNIEKEINDFLYNNPTIEILKILQSESSANADFFNITITIFYRE